MSNTEQAPGTRLEPNLADAVLDHEQRALRDELEALVSEGTSTTAQHFGTAERPSGFYIHGPAGRGKTWLARQVFARAPMPADAKVRIHFHSFFARLQRGLAGTRSSRQAIEETVESLLDGTELFFFDELHVHDPGGASLLNRLLAELVERGVPTIATSNYPPEGLLPHRLYHHVAEPGIRTIREHFAVRLLDGGIDYRRSGDGSSGGRFATGRWIVGAGLNGVQDLSSLTGLHAPESGEATTVLKDHHSLRALAVRGTQVWFDFPDLLEARSTSAEYLRLARDFDDWVLVGVPPLSGMSRYARKRLVDLVDVLTDADRRLTVVSRVSRDDLVDTEREVPADMFRAESRLALLGE